MDEGGWIKSVCVRYIKRVVEIGGGRVVAVE